MEKIICVKIPKFGFNNFTLFKTYIATMNDDSGWVFKGDIRSTFQLKNRKDFITIKEYRKFKIKNIETKR